MLKGWGNMIKKDDRVRLSGLGLLSGLGGQTEVRLDGAETGEEGGSLLVGDRGVNNDIVAVLPVGGGGDSVLVTNLERVHHAQDLVKVATGRGRVRQGQADGLLGVNDEDGANGEWDTLGIEVGQVLVVQHIVQGRDLAGIISNDGEVQADVVDLVDIIDPTLVGLETVGGESNDLDVALSELVLETGNLAELGGADGGEVSRVGEEDNPGVADKVVELDVALGSLGLEVRGDGAEAEGRTGRGHGCKVGGGCWEG